MKSIHGIKNVVVGSFLGGLIGFVAGHLGQAFFLGDATISDISFLCMDTDSPPHQFSAVYLAVKYVNLAVGVCAGAVIGSIAAGTMSISQNLKALTTSTGGIEDVVVDGASSNSVDSKRRVGHRQEQYSRGYLICPIFPTFTQNHRRSLL